MSNRRTHPVWLVIAAMEVEEEAILSRLPSYRSVEISERLGIRASQADLGANQILVTRSGVGQVNAALTLAFAVERHPVDVVLSLGVAGALSTEPGIGDLLLPARVVQHDAVYTSPEGWEPMAPGQLHVSLPKEQRPEPTLPVDAALHAWLLSRLGEMNLPCRAGGTLLSGSEFVASPARKRELAARHADAVAVEMEAAGVAQVARRLGVPFVAAKTIADRLNPDGTITEDYQRFTRRAAQHAARIVDALAKPR